MEQDGPAEQPERKATRMKVMTDGVHEDGGHLIADRISLETDNDLDSLLSLTKVRTSGSQPCLCTDDLLDVRHTVACYDHADI